LRESVWFFLLKEAHFYPCSLQVTSRCATRGIYGCLKTRFRAGSYKEIPDERFEEVMAYLREELRKATGGEGPTQGSLFGP